MKLKNHDKPSLNFIPHSRPTLGEEEIKAVEAVIQSGHIAEDDVLELGDVIAGKEPGRTSEDQITVADLTGVAVQDIQIATAVFKAVQAGS